MTVKTRHNQSPNTSAISAAERTKPKVAEVPAGGPGDEHAVTSVRVLFVHLIWLFIGPLALLLTLYGIAGTGNGWATTQDAVFFVLIGLMVWCRWLDQRSGQGTTINGEPSTWADFRRYALLTPAVAGAAWIVANVIGNHVLTMWGGL
jgi:hypothetical protein